MQAEIISIGDEILIGQIVNTNATYLSQKLTALGIDVKWITTVGDDRAEILTALEIATKRAPIILLTGGLGPTHDDITRKVICEFFNTQLILNPTVLENVRQIFESLGRKLDQLNGEQALVPANATVLNNRIGTAPGLYFIRNATHLFVLPGVPMEMKVIFEDHISGIIQNFNDRGFIAVTTIKSTGIFESRLFQLVSDLVEKFTPQVKIAFLPNASGVNVRLMVAGNPPETSIQLLETAKKQFIARIPEHIYGFDEDLMEALVARELLARGQSVAIADAFTGGILAARLRDLPRSARFFQGSVVWPEVDSPADTFILAGDKFEFKTESATLAAQVSQKVRNVFAADWGISVFPESLSEANPPKVTVGFSGPGFEAIQTELYRKVRTDNKERIAQFILNALRKILLK
jgi:nicotinamide-nucleotide amidase